MQVNSKNGSKSRKRDDFKRELPASLVENAKNGAFKRKFAPFLTYKPHRATMPAPYTLRKSGAYRAISDGISRSRSEHIALHKMENIASATPTYYAALLTMLTFSGEIPVVSYTMESI